MKSNLVNAIEACNDLYVACLRVSYDVDAAVMHHDDDSHGEPNANQM